LFSKPCKKLKEGLDLSEEEKKRKWWERGPGAYYPEKAQGGRVGMAGGMSPKKIDSKKRDLYYKFNRDSYMNMFEYLRSEQSDRDLEGDFKKGGRVGFQEGTGIMSQTGIPYYADKAVEGIINSAETLSKLPFAGGKLISDLLRSPPNKKMFSEALENITPGSWSENLGISSLAEAEGAKVSDKQRAIGNVLGLGTEIAVPVGGAFKIGQNLIKQASKSLGKLKKGKTLDQTINDKITDFGQSRRDFNIVAGTSGLMIALKSIGLGGLLKTASKGKDVKVTYRTGVNEPTNWDDVATHASWYEFEALTAKGANIMKKLWGKDGVKTKIDGDEVKGIVDNVDSGEAISWVDDVKKSGGKMELEHYDDYDNMGKVWKETDKFTTKDKFLNRSGIDSGYGLYDDSIDDVYDLVYGIGPEDPELFSKFSKVKKAAGGRIGLQEGGPTYEDFQQFMKDREKRDRGKSKQDLLDDWKKWKRWKKHGSGSIQEAKDGGIARRPNAVPPLSGPTPQGLTFLLGDDIVKNRIT